MNAKGQVTISGWLTPLIAPPHPSSVLELKDSEKFVVTKEEVASLKRKRASANAAAGDDEDDDCHGEDSSSSSRSSIVSSAPPSPKYDEGISFLPTPTPCPATPCSATSASAQDIQLQVPSDKWLKPLSEPYPTHSTCYTSLQNNLSLPNSLTMPILKFHHNSHICLQLARSGADCLTVRPSCVIPHFLLEARTLI